MAIMILGKLAAQSAETLPCFDSKLTAGFPSPADDCLERPLDLHELVVAHPAATFFVRVQGDSMTGAGLNSGDLLVVDRSLEPKNGNIIVALLNGEFTVKRLKKIGKKIYLAPENPNYPTIEVAEESDFRVWGVVTYSVSKKL